MESIRLYGTEVIPRVRELLTEHAQAHGDCQDKEGSVFDEA